MMRVFENRVLRKIFGPKRDEVAGEWRRLHKEELYDFWSSPNIIRVIKSGRMRWAEPVARIRRRDFAYGVLVRESEGKGRTERAGSGPGEKVLGPHSEGVLERREMRK